MSATSTPTDSPVHFEPLHNPAHAAKVVLPQAPLGNATNGINQVPGMGAKALLAKKMAKSCNPKYISPTDNLMTPCSQKLTAAKKKNFTKSAKAMPKLFASTPTPEEGPLSPTSDEENIPVVPKSEGEEVVAAAPEPEAPADSISIPQAVDVLMDDEENPF